MVGQAPVQALQLVPADRVPGAAHPAAQGDRLVQERIFRPLHGFVQHPGAIASDSRLFNVAQNNNDGPKMYACHHTGNQIWKLTVSGELVFNVQPHIDHQLPLHTAGRPVCGLDERADRRQCAHNQVQREQQVPDLEARGRHGTSFLFAPPPLMQRQFRNVENKCLQAPDTDGAIKVCTCTAHLR